MDSGNNESDFEKSLINKAKDTIVDKILDRFIDENDGRPAHGEKDRARLKEITKEIVDEN